MDLAGVFIGASCLLTLSALLVTVYDGKNMLHFNHKTQAKAEPDCQQLTTISLSTTETQYPLPDFGNHHAIILPDSKTMGAIHDIDISHQITHIPFGTLPTNDEE